MTCVSMLMLIVDNDENASVYPSGTCRDGFPAVKARMNGGASAAVVGCLDKGEKRPTQLQLTQEASCARFSSKEK
jgi:hypothetical protein